MTDVVLPCLDEAAALPWVLARIPSGYRAIVADNGSTDGSPDVARGLGATVVLVPQRGFGPAARAAGRRPAARHRSDAGRSPRGAGGAGRDRPPVRLSTGDGHAR